ncbi:putative lysine-specific histone demethylase Aof2 [Aspergillus thermomutatus]|uniref:SWIRM domain-containing protein n=1 Tax=Aspergillus thermomutatus TaxID=41047 RepID=A0A397I537_ASPTH|nr:uncharacterized protein CDV56_106953 [Aspergillus thermomutatus]RHZ68474.1 hypothetical protein CDV56_106953 [Aspergillus thermomutatus]
METTASMGLQGLNGLPYDLSQFDHYLSQATSYVNGNPHLQYASLSNQTMPGIGEQSEPPAKRPCSSRSYNALNQMNDETSSPAAIIQSSTRPQDVNGILDGGVGGSESTDSTTHDFNEDTSRDILSGSATSVSLMYDPSQKNSTPPSTVNNVTSSSSVTTDPRGLSGSADYARYRPRSSIPSKLTAAVYAQQCVTAAYACRLNPYALHKKEQEALQDHLCHLHVTAYLNIRNGILRLWTRNPMVSVTKDEALGCAKDYRWMGLASFAYEWLVRNGYINFGCIEIPPALVAPRKGRRKDGPVIVVIGAGMAGLGCARQLEGLFNQYHDPLTSPRVVVLEGRRRIGGRIYSHPLRSLQSSKLAPGFVPKAEMVGATLSLVT